MNPLVFVDKCDVGFGVFASRDIKKGETIFIFSGQIVPGDIAKLPKSNAYALQIDVDTYIDPDGLGRFINHSCQPNAGIIEKKVVIALENIPINTEVRFDYSTTMLERFWTLEECTCGAPRCRKVVEDFDLLPLALQQYYLALGIVPDFIIQQLNPVVTTKTQSLPQDTCI